MSAFAVIGSVARDELRRLGVSDPQLFESPYAVDTHEWRRRAEVARPQRLELRASLGFGADDFVLISVGKLLPYKRPLLVLEVFRELVAMVPDARLIVIGDGALETKARRFAAESGLKDSVHFAGFQSQSEVAKYLCAADVLLLLSSETWGLVANEAAACGLPLAVSYDAGCSRDLVVDGVTGLRLSVGSHVDTATRLADLADPAARAGMSAAVTRLTEHFSIARAASGIAAAARSVGAAGRASSRAHT
jgi:glycosyltransferase involved in cell wall biosynthesis